MARRREFARGAAAISHARKTTWIGFIPITSTLTALGGTLYFTLNAAALALRPFTIVRTRFELAMSSDQAAAQEDQTASFGLAVVSDQAASLGVTALPTPTTDAASSMWFVHKWLYGDESSLADNPKQMAKYTVDSKAMRKVEVGQDIAVLAEFVAVGAGLTMLVGGRILVKLH